MVNNAHCSRAGCSRAGVGATASLEEERRLGSRRRNIWPFGKSVIKSVGLSVALVNPGVSKASAISDFIEE